MTAKVFSSKHIKPLVPVPTSTNRSGRLKEKIKCVLFDVYGTLFISGSGDISIAQKKAEKSGGLDRLLDKFGIKESSDCFLNRFFNAIEKEHKNLKENGIDFPEVEIDQIWMGLLENKNLNEVRRFASEFELLVNPVYPMPHLLELLFACKAGNILMGIISNAQFYTPDMFNRFLDLDLEQLGFCPDLIFYSYKFGHAKPSLFLFKLARDKLKEMGFAADATLYLGNDMLKDIYPAKKTGFKTGLFAGDARSLRLRKDDPRCKSLSADIVITDLIQLLDHVL